MGLRSARVTARTGDNRCRRCGSGTWEASRGVYRYGYEYFNDPRYQGRSFTEVEPSLRRDWESRGPPHECGTCEHVEDFFRDGLGW